MFFVGEVEVALHILSFCNLSVKQPCELAVRLRVCYQNQYLGKVSAEPIDLSQANYRIQFQRNDHNKSSLNAEKCSYTTKRFRVRYQDQVVEVGELVTFRAWVDAYTEEDHRNTGWLLTAELLSYSPVQEPSVVSTLHFKTDKLCAAGFVPVYFESFKYCSSLEVHLYSALLGYRFQPNSQFIANVIDRHQTKCRQQHIVQATQLKIPLEFRSFREFLTAATHSFQRGKLQEIYNIYLGHLSWEVAWLKQQIKQFIEVVGSNQHISIVHVLNKLCLPLPPPEHSNRREKKPIFTSSSNRFMDVRESHDSIRSDKSGSSSRISDLLLSPQTIEECFLVDLINYSSGVIEIWTEFKHLVLACYNRSYNRGLREQYVNDSRRCFSAGNLAVEVNQRLLEPPQPHILPVDEVRNCNTQFVFDSPVTQLLQSKPKRCKHLLILVHGFQAYSLDMDALRNQLKYLFPECETFLPTSNEGKTESPLEDQGQRLALEIKNHLNEHSTLEHLRISFVCHSLGNLVMRAALPYLSFFRQHFLYFVSLSGPHLGYLHHSSTLIKTSLWVLNKLIDSPSIKQVCFEDSNQIENTYLYGLSHAIGLEWFKGIVLVASKQDQYVPYHSAQIEMPEDQASGDAQRSRQMIDSLLRKIPPQKILRVDLTYQLKKQDLNSMIGRTAHIQILNDKHSTRILMCLLSELFLWLFVSDLLAVVP